MAEVSQTIKSAIKGSIANPEAALAVIAKLEEVSPEVTPAENVAEITTADATDEASAVILVNECKSTINSIIEALVDAGLMEEP